MKRKVALVALLPLLFCLWASPVRSQRGFFMPATERSIEIPFEYNNNFLILQIVVNNRLPLRFILDTGAGHTILTDKAVSGFLGLKFERTFQVIGSDLSTTLTAHLARGVRFNLSDKVIAPKEDILVLEEELFKFEEYSGLSIHGILSGNVFSRYILKINYDRRMITLYDRIHFGKSDTKGFVEMPIEIFREKPYVQTRLTIAADSTTQVKLLIDTGAALPLLLFADTHPMLKPPARAIPAMIGQGLGGAIDGFTGRVKSLEMGKFKQEGIVTYFQVLDTIIDTLSANKRNGLVGNNFLNRYTMILDYHSEKAWFKPSKRYKEAFDFDRSGIGVILSGENHNIFVVHHVLPGSPATDADVQRGDRILKIGRKRTRWMSLSAVVAKFQGDAGKTILLTLERDGQKMSKEIVLRDLL